LIATFAIGAVSGGVSTTFRHRARRSKAPASD
jgi:hypothetical protein